MISQAEETIRSYTDSHTQPRPSRPLVIGKDRKSYSMNPTTNYISRFVDVFRGCLGCGSVSHLFRECPEKHNKTMNFNFFQDLNVAHINIPDIAHTTTLAPVSSLLPFPCTSLPINLQCITGIDFTYHPTLWNNHATWINSISPLLQLLISSFHLK